MITTGRRETSGRHDGGERKQRSFFVPAIAARTRGRRLKFIEFPEIPLKFPLSH